jgi:hypothetical protein
MKPIDRLIVTLQTALPGVEVRQLQASHPGDDTGLWFVRHPESSVEVNVESRDGDFPFLIENSRNDTRVTTTDLDETLAILRWTLGRYRAQGPPAA